MDLLRPLFRRRRELLGELARAGAEAVKGLVGHAIGEGDARPGIVVSVATAGDLLQWHPHLHLITTDAGRTPGGSWHQPPQWDSVRLMTPFIPDPGQHRTIFYGEYSSRARAGCQPLEPDATSTTADHPPPRRRCPPSWA